MKPRLLEPVTFNFFRIMKGGIYMDWLWIVMWVSIIFYIVTFISKKITEKRQKQRRKENNHDSRAGTANVGNASTVDSDTISE